MQRRKQKHVLLFDPEVEMTTRRNNYKNRKKKQLVKM